MNFKKLIQELKRRNVFKVATAYAIAGWLIIQICTSTFPYLHLPDWLITAVIVFVLIGFPIAVIVAWAFEVTPEGVKRTDEVPVEQSITKKTGRKLNIILSIMLILAVGGLFYQHFATGYSSATNRSTSLKTTADSLSIPQKSIAVLPFDNLNVDKKDAYFVVGMQDLILTKLADIGDMKVISRTSTLQYGSHPQNLKKIGQELGVATLLEGSVQKASNQVLINVQLINAKTDAHIWAQAYTRTLDNVFGVEGEVAEKIAAALKAKLSPAETKRLATALSNDPVANDLFLRGEFFATRGNINTDPVAYRQAIALYRQALAHDPGFALARARLSYAESGLIWFGGAQSDTKELIADAAAQAKQALAEQPDLVAGHLALGYVYYWDQQNYAAALKEFEAALKLQPNDVGTIQARGFVLRRQGRFDAAINAMKRALELDPRNSLTAETLAETLAAVRRYAEAERMVQQALALDPNNLPAKQLYSDIILMSSGDVGGALAAAQGDEPLLRLWRVQLLTYQRKYREAITLIESVPDTPDNFNYQFGPEALQLADLYRLAGDKERARMLYAKALPLIRTQLAALTSNTMKTSFTWSHIAGAKLSLGKTDAALAALAKSQALIAQSSDHFITPWLNEINANRYAQAGRADLAVPLLAKALASPGGGEAYSPMLLKIDPTWDPIRKTPEFQALLKKYAPQKQEVGDEQ